MSGKDPMTLDSSGRSQGSYDNGSSRADANYPAPGTSRQASFEAWKRATGHETGAGPAKPDGGSYDCNVPSSVSEALSGSDSRPVPLPPSRGSFSSDRQHQVAPYSTCPSSAERGVSTRESSFSSLDVPPRPPTLGVESSSDLRDRVSVTSTGSEEADPGDEGLDMSDFEALLDNLKTREFSAGEYIFR